MRHDQPFGRGCPVVFNSGMRTDTHKQQDLPSYRQEDCSEADFERHAEKEDACQPYAAPLGEARDCGMYNEKTAGMVYHAPHDLHNLYDPAHSLKRGTLFDELFKPMDDCNEETRPIASKQQAIAFAAWELRLYLCTHPKDRQALNLYRQLCRQTDHPNYACTFAPLTAQGNTWDWVDDPWPWEYAVHCDRRD